MHGPALDGEDRAEQRAQWHERQQARGDEAQERWRRLTVKLEMIVSNPGDCCRDQGQSPNQEVPQHTASRGWLRGWEPARR